MTVIPITKHTIYEGREIIEVVELEVNWNELRHWRDRALDDSDWRFASDQSPSDEWISYRVFLRDLPQDHPGDTSNDACDAWEDYEKPEGA